MWACSLTAFGPAQSVSCQTHQLTHKIISSAILFRGKLKKRVFFANSCFSFAKANMYSYDLLFHLLRNYLFLFWKSQCTVFPSSAELSVSDQSERFLVRPFLASLAHQAAGWGALNAAKRYKAGGPGLQGQKAPKNSSGKIPGLGRGLGSGCLGGRTSYRGSS